MRKLVLGLLLVLFFAIPGITATLPEPTGYVVDTIGLLKPGTVKSLTTTCENLDKVAQVAVCVVGSTQPDTIEYFSIKLAEKWKVGYKGVDNGIIIILAKTDRKVRIEVGRGMESIITDAKAGRIINDTIIPFFKQGDWDGGLIAGLDAIKKEITK